MKFRIIAFLALLSGYTVDAQTKAVAAPASEQVTQAKTPVQEKSLLWEISGNGLTKPSYLFGTMHILCADDIHLSDAFKKIIAGSDQIYFEVDMDDLMGIMGSIRYLRMTGNKKLVDLLSKEEYDRVKNYFSKNPSLLPFPMMESFKPFFISSLLSEQSMDCPSKQGMEQAIMGEAKSSSKEIKGLETLQFQAGLFDSIPYERQAQELLKIIDSASVQKGDTKELMDIYRNQDLDKIQELTLKEDGVTSEFMNILLYNRNADWAVKMNKLMPGASLLFAVGAAHLPGEKGVINLLQKQGYTVKAIRNQ